MLVMSKDSENWAVTWHIGEKIDSRNLKSEHLNMVQADGDELDYLRSNFTNIPFSTARVNKWQGEFARFIVENFPAKKFS